MSERRDVAKLLLLVGDSLEQRGMDASTGVLRRAARLLLDSDDDEEQPGERICVECGRPLDPPARTGRPRVRHRECDAHARKLPRTTESPT